MTYSCHCAFTYNDRMADMLKHNISNSKAVDSVTNASPQVHKHYSNIVCPHFERVDC